MPYQVQNTSIRGYPLKIPLLCRWPTLHSDVSGCLLNVTSSNVNYITWANMLSVMLRAINTGKLCYVFTRITEKGRRAWYLIPENCTWMKENKEGKPNIALFIVMRKTWSGMTLQFVPYLFKRTDNTAAGIRQADHVATSIRKRLH
jgi:hypothetical protein